MLEREEFINVDTSQLGSEVPEIPPSNGYCVHTYVARSIHKPTEMELLLLHSAPHQRINRLPPPLYKRFYFLSLQKKKIMI